MISCILKLQINADERRCKIPLQRIIFQKMHPNFKLFGCSGFPESSGRLMENIVLLELMKYRNDIIFLYSRGYFSY
jgi:predicted AAA+ superfamily ATPase